MDNGVNATLIGGLLGFLGSILPDVVYAIQRRFNPPVIIESGQVTDGEVQAAVESLSTTDPAKQAEYTLTYIILDFLRASVRPVLTYIFFGVFVFIKLMMFWWAVHVDKTTIIEITPLLWDEATEALFAAVLAFWFGSRAITRFRK